MGQFVVNAGISTAFEDDGSGGVQERASISLSRTTAAKHDLISIGIVGDSGVKTKYNNLLTAATVQTSGFPNQDDVDDFSDAVNDELGAWAQTEFESAPLADKKRIVLHAYTVNARGWTL